jgi:hypothetical protein
MMHTLACVTVHTKPQCVPVTTVMLRVTVTKELLCVTETNVVLRINVNTVVLGVTHQQHCALWNRQCCYDTVRVTFNAVMLCVTVS